MKFDKQSLFLILFLSAIVVASVGDIIVDLGHGAKVFHLIQELVIATLATLLILFLIKKQIVYSEQIKKLKIELKETCQANQKVSDALASARKALSEAIKEQFNNWRLTDTEQEIGILILKGFSHKEIAYFRNVTEKTVRNQSTNIYRKAGVNGKHAFSAWFIEDLL
ncbi:LuxR C-terminal-related transcriptional regulator [Aliikangiella sp. G2MR2-5]|uniref:helix-turn-helix transcriptional regulator n=1 Tax=Aliikangiella sp. G2MR2-5 TaxID=2788943 RepID=UPI0018A91B61|nr:LuxR C-terminal-related transcriptional regulator [Aliikangiella sp. G2MR2-5]